MSELGFADRIAVGPYLFLDRRFFSYSSHSSELESGPFVCFDRRIPAVSGDDPLDDQQAESEAGWLQFLLEQRVSDSGRESRTVVGNDEAVVGTSNRDSDARSAVFGDVTKQVFEQLSEPRLVSEDCSILLYDERCVCWIDSVPGYPGDRAEFDGFTLAYVTAPTRASRR